MERGSQFFLRGIFQKINPCLLLHHVGTTSTLLISIGVMNSLLCRCRRMYCMQVGCDCYHCIPCAFKSCSNVRSELDLKMVKSLLEILVSNRTKSVHTIVIFGCLKFTLTELGNVLNFTWENACLDTKSLVWIHRCKIHIPP